MTQEPLGDYLSRIELQELQALRWGAVDAAWSRNEVLELLRNAGSPEPDRTLARMLSSLLLVETPNGMLRSRMAETVRLVSTLRQTFRGQAACDGVPLVLDYRIVHRARERPSRSISRATALETSTEGMGAAGVRMFDLLVPDMISAFQDEACRVITGALGLDRDTAVMIGAGTGAGKTLAFYMPALAWVADSIEADTSNSVRGLAVYPRKELLRDQASEVLALAWRTREAGRRPLRIGTWFADTPNSNRGRPSGWRRTGGGSSTSYECPYMQCPGKHPEPRYLLWAQSDINAGKETLRCSDSQCRVVIGPELLALSRSSAAQRPPDVMFTTAESLNRQIAAPKNHRAFGLNGALRFVLLDEVHTYEGISGAQTAVLLRRLRAAAGRTIAWTALSATLEQPETFVSGLTGVPTGDVLVVQPRPQDMEVAGAEYMVAVRHSPAALRSPLSTAIQSAMLVGRALDVAPSKDPFSGPTKHSGGLFGRRTFVFTDKLDVTNRLYWALLDAEGWKAPGHLLNPKSHRPQTLAHIRSLSQAKVAPDAAREPAAERDATGQWWWMSELLGHGLEQDRSLTIGRTSSHDPGVDASDVIVATASLEVGYDDPQVGAVIQYTAPHDPARFLQRKGRAGRDPGMRPWTLVVLADQGRDRAAWDLYEDLFSPVLKATRLPLENRHVLRMQAVYSLLDWLGHKTGSTNVWRALAGPADVVSDGTSIGWTRKDQDRIRVLLDRVIDGQAERDMLIGHLQRSLGLPSSVEGARILHSVMWGSPRPLLAAVVPTIRRRLRDQWLGEVPSPDDPKVKYGTPLREFIPGNLFDDLLLPDVEVQLPKGITIEQAGDSLPVFRAINELAPGNVTKHFGVKSESRRHWVPLPLGDLGTGSIDVVGAYGARPIADFLEAGVAEPRSIRLYRPVRVALEEPAIEIKDSSRTRPVWSTRLDALGHGTVLPGLGARWGGLLQAASAHVHRNGGRVLVRRYATEVRGRQFPDSGRPVAVRKTYTAGDPPEVTCALGAELEADGLQMQMNTPELPPPDADERTGWYFHTVRTSPALGDEVSELERGALAGAYLAMRTAKAPGSPTLSLSQWLVRLGGVAEGDDGDGSAPSRLAQEAEDPQTQDVLREAYDLAQQQSRNPDWRIWAVTRVLRGLAQTLLDAASLMRPNFSVDDLAVDVVPGLGESPWRLWITETAPGGNGQVEQLVDLMENDPVGLAASMDAAARPSALECLDDDLRRFLVWLQEAPAHGEDGEAVRNAWSVGHRAVSSALESLRSNASQAIGPLGATSWNIIGSRFLGPGSVPAVIATVEDALALWDGIVEADAVQVNARIIGAHMSERTDLDGSLRLPAGVNPSRRAQAVANLLWPRGSDPTAALWSQFDPFYQSNGVDLELLRRLAPPPETVLDVGTFQEWQSQGRAWAHEVLREHRRLALRSAAPSNDTRRVLLDLQMAPIDMGLILAFPTCNGVSRDGEATVYSVVLREDSAS